MMRKPVVAGGMIVALAALAAVAVSRQNVVAQQGGQGWPYAKVAVINVKQCMESYEKFNANLTQWKTDVETKETELKAKQQELVTLQQSAGELTEEGKLALQKQVNDISFELNSLKRKYTTELANQEMQVHQKAYAEVNAAVGQYCKEQDIHLVIRLMDDLDEEMAKQPAMVMRHIYGQQVIYHHPYINITKPITDYLNSR